MFRKLSEKEFENKMLCDEYKSLLSQRIRDMGLELTDKQIRKTGWEKLEYIYEQELAKKVRTVFDPEPCNHCGFPYRKQFAWSKCPRCGK